MRLSPWLLPPTCDCLVPGDIVRALESLDAFLIAFVLFTFGYGILALIVLSHRPETGRVPEVLVPESIAALAVDAFAAT